MSPARDLCWSNVEAIVERLSLDEIPGADGPEYMVLSSAMTPDPVGALRVFHRRDAVTLVYVGMTVAPIGLDSHMMFAFTPPTSAVPHFTVDSVKNADDFAFHLDLIPRARPGRAPRVHGPLLHTADGDPRGVPRAPRPPTGADRTAAVGAHERVDDRQPGHRGGLPGHRVDRRGSTATTGSA